VKAGVCRIDIHAGLHTGECELTDSKVGGLVVHIGARVAAQAEPGEVLVSSTVKDLVAGSGIRSKTAAPISSQASPESGTSTPSSAEPLGR
jgi:class 3 adenylate cyclase